MVLVGRRELLANFRQNRALDALISALFDSRSQISLPDRISQTDDAVIAIMAAIVGNRSRPFKDAISMLNRRKIDESAEWIHDDLLLFSVIAGNLRFGGSDQLVEQLLRVRLSGSEGQSQDMSLSLKALAEQKSDAPLLPVLLVGQVLVEPDHTWDRHLLSRAFEQSTQLESESDAPPFIRLLGEKVADVSTRIGVETNGSEYSALSSFRSGFDRRVRCFAGTVFFLLLVGSAAGWFMATKLFFSENADSEELAGKLFDMGIVIGPIAVFLARKAIFSFFRSSFYRIFGGKGLLDYESRSK